MSEGRNGKEGASTNMEQKVVEGAKLEIQEEGAVKVLGKNSLSRDARNRENEGGNSEVSGMDQDTLIADREQWRNVFVVIDSNITRSYYEGVISVRKEGTGK